MAKRRRILISVIVVAVVALLGAVAAVVIPIITHESGGASGQHEPDGYVSEVSAIGDDGRTRELKALLPTGEPADLSALTSGDEILVQGSGFDASIGIYVGFCRVPDTPQGKPGPCLGGIPEGAEEEKTAGESEPLESAWITNNWAWKPFATDQYDDASLGTFSIRLVVPAPVSDTLDCTSEVCGIYTRADHTAAGDRVQDVYLPFRIIP